MNNPRDKDSGDTDEKEASPPPSSSTPQSGEASIQAEQHVASATSDDSSKPPRIVPAPISSNPIVIGPDSLPPASENVPPSTIIENAMTRGRAPLPLTTIIGIGFGVFVVLVGLTLLLFR